jgi:alkanesulfonate monooxygenase SsuD/methylene tetrahydromethanopterin reductase-like flavin-dependent oxidoreductase (luciferase family)
MGFDAVWVHDHVVWSSEMHRHHISSGAAEALSDTQDANFFEATTILSYLAAETKKIVLGVDCLVMPCRNPIYARNSIRPSTSRAGPFAAASALAQGHPRVR